MADVPRDTPTALEVHAPSGAFPFPQYDIGMKGDNGGLITAIVAREPGYVIYVTEDHKSGFEATSEVMNANKTAIDSFDRINSKIFTILPKDKREYPAKQLGYALSGCFIYDDSSGLSLLENIDKFVDDKLNEVARYYYLSAALLSLTLGSAVIWSGIKISVFDPLIAPSAIYGALGAVASMCIRISDVKTDGFFSHMYVAMAGFSRVFLGSIFGLLSYFLITGNVLFGFLSSSPTGFILAAVAAGFNERLVPEMLDQLGRS